jgi:cytochrome c oxidase subunit 4
MSHHVSSAIDLWKVGASLLVLTIVTVAVAFVHIPFPYNIIVALAIAVVKAWIVATYFMNLKWDEKFNAILLIAGIVFVLIFFGITMLDTLTRGEAIVPSF